MGMDVSASTAVGLLIEMKSLQRTVWTPHSEHVVPVGANFCPTCGKPATVRSTEDIPEYTYDTLSGFKVIHSQSDEKHCLVCDMSVETYAGFAKMKEMPDLEAIRTKMKATFIPLGIWNEDNFGIWVINTSSW